MKRGLVIALVMLMAVCLGTGGFIYWCIGTSTGTRWLLETAGRIAKVEISMSALSGSLRDNLSVEGLQIVWQGGRVEIGDFDLTLHEGNLWSGVLALENLTAHHLALQIDNTEQPSSPEPAEGSSEFVLARIPDWLKVTIDHLEITDFVLRDSKGPADQVIIANLIAGRYELAGQRLTAQDFSYHSPYVELDGEFNWELTRPHLVMTADVHLPETSVDPALFTSIRVPIDFPGHLELDGDWNAYSGPVRFGLVNETAGTVWLSARATGSLQGIRFDDLQGRYLEGEVTGDLDLSWVDSYQMGGQLSGRDLDLAALIEGVTGKTTLDASVELLVPYDEKPLQANLAAVLHKGQFRNHSLQGRAAGQWLGTRLVNIDVDLSGEGTRLVAKGIPAERVDIELNATDLSMLHADLAGQATARGWASWTDGSLTGEIEGHGEGLGWQETKIQEIAFDARHPVAGEEIEITLTGDNLSRGSILVDRVAADLKGNPAAHRLKVIAEADIGHFTADATGQYQDGRWTGSLENLAGLETPWGAWLMPKTTALEWQDGVVSIDDLQLQGDQGTRLTLGVEQWGSPDQTAISLTWTGFVLAWLEPQSGISDLTGLCDGDLSYKATNGLPLSISGHVTADAQVKDEYFELSETPLDLDFNWDQEGLHLTGNARSKKGEEVSTKLSSSGPPSWTWPIAGLAAELTWQQLELARFDRFLDNGRLEGQSKGKVSLEFTGESPLEISAQISAQGRVMQGETELGPNRLQADLHWNSGGFLCEATLDGKRGGHASLRLNSAQGPVLALPEAGQIDLEVTDLSVAAFELWMPQDIDVGGTLNGKAAGIWDENGDIDLSGQLQLSESRIIWSTKEGQLRLPLQDAMAEWTWTGESLNGAFSLDLAGQGEVKGKWQLPLPARIPTTFAPEEPLRLNVEGRVQSIGTLSSLGPWLAQEVHGETLLTLDLQGTWADPDLNGQLIFNNGGAYLPKTGIQLEDIHLRAELDDSRLRIEEFTLHSGPGNLKGEGEVIFDGWALSSYRLDFVGDSLQVVDFPELQVLASPEVIISGNTSHLSLQGSVLIPVLSYTGSRAVPEVLPSKDVVDTASESQRKTLSLATDVQLDVTLGDNVTINAGGIKTHLAGEAIVTIGPTGEFLAKGEIQLVSGSYKAYGTTLQIRQGVVSYDGGAVTNPKLYVFAAREVGDVLAGVQVTGNLEAPVISLYSRPAMPERDILGYMLMGRAVSADSQGTDMLMMGAGTLLPGSGEGLAELGIAEIDLQGLFDGSGGVLLRHKLTDQWEVESTLGVESGIDLYYIIEFE